MKFIVSGKNIDVTEALKEKVSKKLGKLSKFFNEDTEVHATFSCEKNKQIIEVTIPFNGMIFRATEKNEDMYTSIDKVVDVLEAQVIKNKTKFEKKASKESIKTLNAYGDEDDGSTGVIEYKKYTLKPMTLEEAIMQMTSRKKQLFVYCDIDTKSVNAVYRLGDGQYGLIEPEA